MAQAAPQAAADRMTAIAIRDVAFLVVVFSAMAVVSVGMWIPYARSARASTAGERRASPDSGARVPAS